MAGIFTVTSEGNQALSGGATSKTHILVLGAAGVNAKLIEFGVSMAGTVSTDTPVLWELYQITSVGSGGTALTEYAWQRVTATVNCAGTRTPSGEPSKGGRIANWNVHPQGGSLIMQYPLGREPVLCDGSASQGLALVYTTAANVTPGCVSYMVWEE